MSFKRSPAHKVYKDQMSQLDYGDALWEPAPLDYFKRIQIGDVGYIRRGCFHLLFSAGRALGERDLGIDVPLTFEPLDVGRIFNLQPRLPGHLSTDPVTGPEVEAPTTAISMLEPGFSVSFESSEKQGATLVTKHLTYREDIQQEQNFEEYIKQHYDSWVAFAREAGHGNDIKPILVAGVDMTSDFAMMSYSGNSGRLKSEFRVLASEKASPSAWGMWRTRGFVHTNCGPQSRLPPGASAQTAASTPRGTSHTEPVSEEYNQCVFVRYYAMRKRPLFAPKVIKAGAGPHNLGPGSREGGESPAEAQDDSDSDNESSLFDDEWDDRSSVTSVDSEPDMVIRNTITDERDNFDEIADYIFQNSYANSAIIHHRDIALLREGANTKDVSTLLFMKPPPIVVGGDGVGRIHHRGDPTKNSGCSDLIGATSSSPLPITNEIEQEATGRMALREPGPLPRPPRPEWRSFSDPNLTTREWKELGEVLLETTALAKTATPPDPPFIRRCSKEEPSRHLLLPPPHEKGPIVCALRVDQAATLHTDAPLPSIQRRPLPPAEWPLNYLSDIEGEITRQAQAANHLRFDEKVRQKRVRPLAKAWGRQRILPIQKECVDEGSRQHSGGYSEVNNGEYPGHNVADRVKTSQYDLGRIYKSLRQLILEVKRLPHPNVVFFSGVSISMNPDYCILTERISNGDLIQYTGSNSKEDRLPSFSEAAPCVGYPHRLGIARGDLEGTVSGLPKRMFVLNGNLDLATMGDHGPMKLLDLESWSDLHALEVTSTECLSKLRSLLNCPSKIAAARSLQGNDAEMLVNVFDQVLERSCLDVELSQRCLRLLSKICKAQRIIPASYLLQQESIHVGGVLDHGGFAEVSDGKYLGYTVAIKHLKTNNDDPDKMFKRFCREIISWRHLSHPNILPLIGVSVSTALRSFRILTEWMSNGNLVQYTKANPEANRLQLLSEVASGVAYLHPTRIIHGDLKGVNILVDNTGPSADFGFLSICGLGANLSHANSDFACGGTYRWAHPELLDPSRPGPGSHSTPDISKTDRRLWRSARVSAMIGRRGAHRHIPPFTASQTVTDAQRLDSVLLMESDRRALGMVIDEDLTGLRPLPGPSVPKIRVAIATGGYPLDDKPLGHTDALWELVHSRRSKPSSDRPISHSLPGHLSGDPNEPLISLLMDAISEEDALPNRQFLYISGPNGCPGTAASSKHQHQTIIMNLAPHREKGEEFS